MPPRHACLPLAVSALLTARGPGFAHGTQVPSRDRR